MAWLECNKGSGLTPFTIPTFALETNNSGLFHSATLDLDCINYATLTIASYDLSGSSGACQMSAYDINDQYVNLPNLSGTSTESYTLDISTYKKIRFKLISSKVNGEVSLTNITLS